MPRTMPSESAMLAKLYLERVAGLDSVATDRRHRVEHGSALVSTVVEVRPDTDPDARSVVHRETPRDQLVVHVLRVARVDRHVTATVLRLDRRPYDEAALQGAFDQRLRQRHGAFADALQADLAESGVRRCGDVGRGH